MFKRPTSKYKDWIKKKKIRRFSNRDFQKTQYDLWWMLKLMAWMLGNKRPLKFNKLSFFLYFKELDSIKI